jgi:hypothetical protein
MAMSVRRALEADGIYSGWTRVGRGLCYRLRTVVVSLNGYQQWIVHRQEKRRGGSDVVDTWRVMPPPDRREEMASCINESWYLLDGALWDLGRLVGLPQSKRELNQSASVLRENAEMAL